MSVPAHNQQTETQRNLLIEEIKQNLKVVMHVIYNIKRNSHRIGEEIAEYNLMMGEHGKRFTLEGRYSDELAETAARFQYPKNREQLERDIKVYKNALVMNEKAISILIRLAIATKISDQIPKVSSEDLQILTTYAVGFPNTFGLRVFLEKLMVLFERFNALDSKNMLESKKSEESVQDKNTLKTNEGFIQFQSSLKKNEGSVQSDDNKGIVESVQIQSHVALKMGH